MTDFFSAYILPLSLAGSAISIVLLLLSRLVRKTFRSRWQYYSWAVALLVFAFPFPIKLPAAPVAAAPMPFVELPAVQLVDFMLDTPLSSAASFPIIWGELLTVLWAVGTLLFLLHHCICAARFHLTLKRTVKLVSDLHTLDMLAACKRQKSIGRSIPVYTCPLVGSPMLVGILHPRIILPESAFTEDELRLIFLHELTHYRHGDLIYKLAALLIHTVHWFNPLSWMIVCQLNVLCELACDETLVQRMELAERKGYGIAILNIIGETRLVPPVSTSFSLKKEELRRRLTLIMDYQRSTKLLLCAGFCSMALLTFVGISVSSYVLGEAPTAIPSISLEAASDFVQSEGSNQKAVDLEKQQQELRENQAKINATIAESQAAIDETTASSQAPALVEVSPTDAQNIPDIQLQLPVADTVIITGFGDYRGHVGVDFIKKDIFGADIVAAADGTIVLSTFYGAYGNTVIIDHGNGVQTLYAHCNTLAFAVEDDNAPIAVKKGDVIATVGSSGSTTGPNCHFELRSNGRPIDPKPFFVNTL